MAAPKEALSEQKDHKKLIEKGKPDDILPGFKNRHVGSTLKPKNVMRKFGVCMCVCVCVSYYLERNPYLHPSREW